METIGSVIHKILKSSGKETLYYEGVIKNNWEEFVGNMLANITFPERINSKILYLKCSNPAWKQEIFFLKNKIIEKINSYFNREIILDIKVFVKK